MRATVRSSPHRLAMDEMEYTTMPELMEKHKGKWESVK